MYISQNKSYIIGTVLSLFILSDQSTDPFSQAEITNGLIRARIYLPDSKDGYYRATRFDWSGVIPALEYKGHTYFGQWFDTYSPTRHDAIMGPVEDFSPVGYEEARIGDSFLKIGIGMMTKPEEPKYFIATRYQLVNPGAWKVKEKKDQVEFIQVLTDKEYGYEYRKSVRLVKGKPEMILSHSLKNTGKRAIESNVYDHNFFLLDGQLTGQGLVIKFPFNLTGQARETGDFGKMEGNQIIFLKDLKKNEHLHYESLLGFGNNKKDYDIRIENHKTGAAVRITGDQPLSRLAFWCAQKTVCPEPYIKVSVKPGELFTWNITYQFYICDIIN